MNNMLSNKGLTSSEANHITNITKELVKDLAIDNFKLATTSAIRGGTEHPMDENKKNENWVEDIKRIGELYSLSAWLKSAIKSKESLLDEVEHSDCKVIVTPNYSSKPERPETDISTFLNTLSVKDRNEYLSNEALASHIGQFVHNFDAIRAASENFQPTSFQQVNGELITVKNTRLYKKEELIEGFFELQKQHREAEKVVNLYKSRYKDWNKSVEDDYTNAEQVWYYETGEITRKHKQEQESLRLEFEKEKREKKASISALKIVIPSELQSTLDFVNQYAKK